MDAFFLQSDLAFHTPLPPDSNGGFYKINEALEEFSQTYMIFGAMLGSCCCVPLAEDTHLPCPAREIAIRQRKHTGCQRTRSVQVWTDWSLPSVEVTSSTKLSARRSS